MPHLCALSGIMGPFVISSVIISLRVFGEGNVRPSLIRRTTQDICRKEMSTAGPDNPERR